MENSLVLNEIIIINNIYSSISLSLFLKKKENTIPVTYNNI